MCVCVRVKVLEVLEVLVCVNGLRIYTLIDGLSHNLLTPR